MTSHVNYNYELDSSNDNNNNEDSTMTLITPDFNRHLYNKPDSYNFSIFYINNILDINN